jgi:hypothetical protein
MKPACLLLLIASHLAGAMAAPAAPPAELMRFVEPGTELLSFNAADLNGDSTQDYLVVLQRKDTEGTRPLLIIGREKTGALRLLKRNEVLVGCANCGGMMGDPLQAIEVKGQGFTVANAGGSIDRWSNRFSFAWSRADKSWQLVRAEASSFSAPEPDETFRQNVHLPPRDFGKIDLADFDPDRYLDPRRALTLCGKEETDYLSCPTGGGKKTLSVCGNVGEDGGGWLQYRFGKPGKIELAFPQEKRDSLSKFEGNFFNPREQPRETSELRFVSGKALYSVSLDRDGSDHTYHGAVDVMLGKTKRVAIACDAVDGLRYFEAFRELNGRLAQPDGKTDMLQRFVRDAAR